MIQITINKGETKQVFIETPHPEQETPHPELVSESLNESNTEHSRNKLGMRFYPENDETLILQQENSTLDLFVFYLSEQSAEHKIIIRQQGEHCTTNIYGLAVLHGEQHYTCDTLLEHQCPNGKSELLFKYLLFDKAHGGFTGRLKVHPDAQHTDASQTNRNIILSDTAKMRTMPQLEIYADDVKCSHGATTGTLDEQALFYMQQRGIPMTAAKQLLLQAFAEEVIEKLPKEKQETIRNNFIDIIQQ